MKDTEINEELYLLAEKMRKEVFNNTYKKLKDTKLNDRTLDAEVLDVLKNFEISEEKLKIKFSKPEDPIYKAEAGRTPYDLLCKGKINEKEFTIFINNKFGRLDSKTRNDITTYNNLLRLYLGIVEQRLSSKIIIDKKLIHKLISNKEIISYGVFVIDKEKKGWNFFLLEEVEEPFYVNPRNNMFQLGYKPSLRKPIGYYSFVTALINSILEALNKSLESTQTEIVAINGVMQQLKLIRSNYQNE